MMRGTQDLLWAAAAGVAALVVYVRTLAPGLVETVDTPVFQFVGRVLGVPHNPGYPLYVLLTYPLSFLPIASLAYRINLFSALCGSLAVALVFLVGRGLGCRRLISLGAALGVAFGQVFWSQAVIAEVYMLHAALIAGVLLSLVVWRERRNARWFFLGVAVFALGLGNHTTIVAFAPAMLAFALLVDRRFTSRPRTILLAGALVVAGLLQYAFILVRSRDATAYVESRATTLGELLDVMLARQFQDRLFAFGWREVLLERLPVIVSRVLVPELTWPGTALAALGLGWLLWRRPAEGLLLMVGGTAIVGFALVYSVVDTPVFLIPAFVVLWVAAGVGGERVAAIAVRKAAAGTALGLAFLTLPGWLLVQNFGVNDRSRDTEAAVHFDALFERLPDRTALVREDFLVDRMVLFKLLGEQAAREREIELVSREPDVVRSLLGAGFRVFAFLKSARQLRHEGLDVGFSPVPLLDGRLAEFFSRVPDGHIVAVAVPRTHAERFASPAGLWLETLGGATGLAVSQGSLAVLGVRGSRQAPAVRASPSVARLDLSVGRRIGDTAVRSPWTIEVIAGADEAVVRQEGRDVAWTTGGGALAVWRPDGRLQHALILQEEDGYRVPTVHEPLSVNPVRGLLRSVEVPPDRWEDVTWLGGTGSVLVRTPAASTTVLYIADDRPMAPRVIDRSVSDVAVHVEAIERGAGQPSRTRASLDEVGRDAALGLDPEQHGYRIEVRSPPNERGTAFLALGGVPSRAVARSNASGSEVAAVFRVETDGLLRSPDRRSALLVMSRDEQSQLIGPGWSAVDSDATSPYRWMTSPEARVVLPIVRDGASSIRVQALFDGAADPRVLADGDPAMIGLRVNGTTLAAQPLRPGWHLYEWQFERGLVGVGVNQAWVTKSPGPRVAVAHLRVVHER